MNDQVANNYIEQAAEERKRSPWIALVLSLFTYGVGQIYNGQIAKGVIWYLIVILSIWIAGVSGVLDSFVGLAALLSLEIVVKIYLIVDAVRTARRNTYIHPVPRGTKLRKWIAALLLLGAAFLVNINVLTGYQTFRIPTTSSEPNLFVGDYLFADLRYYNDHAINRGDLIVYNGDDGYSYCCRVVALPGDRFSLVDNVVHIDGVAAKFEFISDTISEGMNVVKKYQETLPDGKSHYVLLSSWNYEGMIKNVEEVVIPDGYYFLLGDNRDNSLDSRYRGFISVHDVIGKCLYTYYSPSANRNIRYLNTE